MEHESSDAPVPPTNPQEERPVVTPPAWPMVFGVIGIVWGAFILLSTGCGLAMMPFQIGMAEAAQSETERRLYEQAAQQAPMTIVVAIVTGLVAIVLIIGGAMLLNRRRRGVKLFAFWCWFDLVTTIGGCIWGALFYGWYFDYFVTDGTSNTPVLWGLIGAAFGMVFTLLTLALPVTFLVWIRRERIRRDIQGWS